MIRITLDVKIPHGKAPLPMELIATFYGRPNVHQNFVEYPPKYKSWIEFAFTKSPYDVMSGDIICPLDYLSIVGVGLFNLDDELIAGPTIFGEFILRDDDSMTIIIDLGKEH